MAKPERTQPALYLAIQRAAGLKAVISPCCPLPQSAFVLILQYGPSIRAYTKRNRSAARVTTVGGRLQPDLLAHLDVLIAAQPKPVSQLQAIRAFVAAGLNLMLRALRAAKASEAIFNLDAAAECRDRGWLRAQGGSFALTAEVRNVMARHTL